MAIAEHGRYVDDVVAVWTGLDTGEDKEIFPRSVVPDTLVQLGWVVAIQTGCVVGTSWFEINGMSTMFLQAERKDWMMFTLYGWLYRE